MDIKKFYEGKTILVTGATGFLGKAVIERLLYSFPYVNKIYIIIRCKNGESFEDRRKQFIENPAFVRIRRELFLKIVWLEGDLSQPNIGLNNKSIRHIIQNVEIIIHSAANIQLWAKLEILLQTNVSGTEFLLEIGKKCKKLISFMHVSTLFCSTSTTQLVGDEKIIYNPDDCKQLLQKLKDTSDVDLKRVTLEIIGDAYSPYSFSKNLTENLVEKYAQMLPVGIFRPGAVTHAAKEPFPGWFDSYNGILLAFKGITLGYTIHSTKINNNSTPIDYVTNALLAATCENTNLRVRPKVYNYSSYTNPCTHREAKEYLLNNLENKEMYHLKRMLYYMMWKLRKMIEIDELDKKTMKDIQYYNNFIKSVNVHITTVATFYNHNIQELWNSLNEEDKRILYFDINDINWEEYIKIVIPKLLMHHL